MKSRKDGHDLSDFKYTCVGYSIFLENDETADKQEHKAQLPFCAGTEVLFSSFSILSFIWYISAEDNHIFVTCFVDVICEVELNTINGNNIYNELCSSSVYSKILHPNINQHHSVVVCLLSLVRFRSWIFLI